MRKEFSLLTTQQKRGHQSTLCEAYSTILTEVKFFRSDTLFEICPLFRRTKYSSTASDQLQFYEFLLKRNLGY